MHKAVVTILLVMAFAYGVAVGHYQIFPFDIIQMVRAWASGDALLGRYGHRKRLLEESVHQSDVVMLGDSITAGGNWARLLPGTKVSNHGIGGDHVSDVRGRIGITVRAKPKVVFLMIGINDVERGSLITFVDDYRQVVSKLDGAGAIVIAQSILMTTRTEWNATIADLNTRIAALCSEYPHCRYLDLNPTLAPDGVLQHSVDGIHITNGGYQLWARAIAPIASILK